MDTQELHHEIAQLRAELEQVKAQVAAMKTLLFAGAAPMPQPAPQPKPVTRHEPSGFAGSLPNHPMPQLTPEQREVGDIKRALRKMSPRHHAALQVLIRGASNKEIGDRFGVGENGAKTYVWGIFRHLNMVKMQGNKRAMVALKVKPVIDGMDGDVYLRLAGIPKNWDADFETIGHEWEHVFRRGSNLMREEEGDERT